MKTSIFNLNRFGLLFRRYFMERFHTELIYWSIMVIAFMLIRNVIPLITLLVIIAGAFYAARFFREIHSPSNGVAYFMIPATQFEKLIVSIIMTTVYYFGMMIIVYIIGNLLGTLLFNMVASIDFLPFQHSDLQWKLFSKTFVDASASMRSISIPFKGGYFLLTLFKFYILQQSTYLLGSIYFKNNQFFKTYLAAAIIQLLLVILVIIEVRIFFGTAVVNVNIDSPYDFGLIAGRVLNSIIYVLTPFFWIVSYFRLTEKQI